MRQLVPSLPTDPDTDADLIRRSLHRPVCFRALFERHGDAIFRYLCARVGPDCAEDLCSETFLLAFGARQSFRPSSSSARPWLFGIAGNVLLRHRSAEADWLRQRRTHHRDRPALDVADESIDRVDAARRMADVTDAVGGLSHGERDALLLYALSGLSYAEIALALDIRPGTVRSRINRARASLRDTLDPAVTAMEDSHD